jgi:hypothetical protein
MGDAPLRISPAELAFERAFRLQPMFVLLARIAKAVSAVQLNKTLTETLTLYNATDAQLAYKLKTTAAKRYCIRPNAGFLGPKETVEVEGSLLEPSSAACHMRAKPSEGVACSQFSYCR